MKDITDPNYHVRITAAEGAVDPKLGEYLPGSYSIVLNNVVELVILPWLGRSPWPPDFPEAFEAFSTQDEAARYVLATTPVVVAPHDDPHVQVEQVSFPEQPEVVHNVIWIPRGQHQELLRDVDRVLELPMTDLGYRLDALGSGALSLLLRTHLPCAMLDEDSSRALALTSALH